MSIGTSFFDAAATVPQKHREIGRLKITAKDAEETSNRLRSIVGSIDISAEYKKLISEVTRQGVRDFLESVSSDAGITSFHSADLDGQALHNSIMAHVPEKFKNLITISSNDVPEVANVVSFEDAATNKLGYHWTFSGGGAPAYEIGFNTAMLFKRQAVKVIAHETAHHIETKLALMHSLAVERGDPELVPQEFRLDAECFYSLGNNGAYINGSHGFDLYQSQINERIARDAEDVASEVMREFGL